MKPGTFIKDGKFTPLSLTINYIFKSEYPNHIRRFDRIKMEQVDRVMEVLNVIHPEVKITRESLNDQLWWTFGLPRTTSEKFRTSYEMRENVYMNSYSF
jgi:hypothetical protein